MIELILNLSNNTAHLCIDGMTHEQCNIDQLNYKQAIPNQASIRAAAEYAEQSGWKLCERCFFDIHD